MHAGGARRTGGDAGALQRRTLRVLVAAQVLAGAGLAAGITVGALLAEEMAGATGWAGLPAALFTLGSAGAALGIGRLSQGWGRRAGLASGYAIGALGAALVVAAAAVDSLGFLFAGLVLYGAGSAANLQARYAGADLAEPDRRGRAISTVLVATTLGAVLGPNLVEPTGRLAGALGVRELAGPFILAAVGYALAGVAVLALLRPDPLLTARALGVRQGRTPAGPPGGAGATRTLRVAAAAMVTTQLVMIAVMTMTPVHMRDHGHALGEVGLVISLHVAAMYLPSPLSGRLADRVGRRPVLVAAVLTMLAAGLLAAAARPGSVPLIAVSLMLLGLGWNLGLVGGTALVTDAVPLARRASVQGRIDLGIALAGSAGGLGSGLVVAWAGYAALAIAGGVAALALIPLLVSERRERARPGPAAVPGRQPL
jgi:MFS family permease